MNFNDLLIKKKIDPQKVLIFRHRPSEPKLNKIFLWLTAEKPDVFNAYQQTQGEKLQKVMESMIDDGYVASFIGHEPGKALFIGLYSIGATTPLSFNEYWSIPAYKEMKKYGMKGFTKDANRRSILWFDLILTDFYASWKGKLIIDWPPPERSWWRRAHKNDMPIFSILQDSALDGVMPEWDKIVLSWDQLSVLPSRWKSILSQWRGIYYIFDNSSNKGYVGSAYGETNLYGRWLSYANSGHGGNALLKQRDPKNFHFSILQRVSPDMDANDLIRLESTWKDRLHTRYPFGYNDN